MKKEQVKRKVCLLGDGAVGKTSLVRRFVLNEFDDKYISTIGTKVSKKDMTIEFPEHETEVNLLLMLWDIMGQNTFDIPLELYFRDATGAIFVCDSTRYDTLKHLDEEWIPLMTEITGDIPFIVAANKHDLTDQVQVEDAELNMLCEKYGCGFVYTSAKTGDSVEDAFQSLGRRICREMVENQTDDEGETVERGSDQGESSSGGSMPEGKVQELIEKGKAAYADGRYQDAIDLFDQVLEMDPQNERVSFLKMSASLKIR